MPARYVPSIMGLLSKTNPKATFRSVLRRAVLQLIIGAALYLLFCLWNEKLRAIWPLALPLWALGCALVGALFEWQIAEEDDSEPPDK